VTIATAITSLVTGHAVQKDIAMTGEMTLRGDILPVGGIKEKILAARRCGIRRVALPGSNRRDLDDLAPDVKADMEFLLIRTIDEALALAIPDLAVRPPEARRARS
jgi:ATP-dependent Lon protease